jgi:alkaline phosphatase D
MLGALTDDSVRVWVRTDEATPFDVRVYGSAAPLTASASTSAGSDFTGVVVVEGLDPDTTYEYEVLVDGEVVSGRHSFRTAPTVGRRGTFSMGFGGCAGYTPENERMWSTIASHDLLGFLFLGDNVYIDLPEMPGPFHEYSYYRRQSRPEFRQLVATIPQYAIWDDHDAAFDDVWLGPYVDRPDWKRPMIESFAQNWNNPAYGSETAPGTWFRFAVGDVDFFMLDGRTYRTNPFIDERTMLGPEQKAWLLEGLKRSEATFKVIASPVAWADGAKPDSVDTWSGFSGEREEIFSFVESNGISGVVLLSSDRHRSEAWKIERASGYTFFDLLSGQLTNIHTHPAEKGALFSYNAKDSFGLLTFETDRPDPRVTFRILSIDNEVIETLVIALSELTTE